MIDARRGYLETHAREAALPVTASLSTMGKLFIAILLIAVFEGAMRKWVSLDWTTPLVLLRDTLAVWGALLGIRSGRMNGNVKSAQALWLWSAMVVLWGLLQLIVNGSSPVVLAVGIRFWLLYLWFAYAAAILLTATDFRFIGRVLLGLLLLLVPLAVMQYYAPPTDILNKTLDDDMTGVFLVVQGVVRTTATFSFALGYSTFLAIATPFLLALLEPGYRVPGGKWIPRLLIFVLSVGTLVSGSRSALLMFGGMLFVFVICSFLYSRMARMDNFILRFPLLLAVLVAASYVSINAVDTMQQRFELAAESEDFSMRLEDMFVGESVAYEEWSFLGEGIGGGTNFAAVEATGQRGFMLAETESARILLEGGLLGAVFIGLKLVVIFLGGRQSWKIARSSGDILPLMLWVTLAIALLTWSIIGQLTVNVLGCLLLGLSIASLRPGMTGAVSGARAGRPAGVPQN